MQQHRAHGPRCAVAGLLLFGLTGCGSEPDVVTFEVEGSRRADWGADAAACLDPSWERRLAPLEPAVPDGVTITVPTRHLDYTRAFVVADCLRARDGVTWVNVPAPL